MVKPLAFAALAIVGFIIVQMLAIVFVVSFDPQKFADDVMIGIYLKEKETEQRFTAPRR